MAQINSAVVSLPWCSTVPLAPVCWQAPNVIIVTVPQQISLPSNPHSLCLADAIPVPDKSMNVQDNGAHQGRGSVGMRRPRSGCRAEARRRRDGPNCQRGDTQRDLLQNTSSDKLASEAARTASLRSHFSELDGVPCNRIFLVRKIQRLGLESADAVRAHFSAYGDVEDVLVAHSPVLSGCKTFVRRLRPSNLAIVIMATTEMAARVHSQGRDQTVNGSSVCVEPYERRGQAEGKAEAESETGDVTNCSDLSCDADSTADGDTSCHSDMLSEMNDEEEACITGDFEYWATDDEGEW